MQVVEFSAGTLRFLETPPPRAPDDGFVWIYLERDELQPALPMLQRRRKRSAARRCSTCT